jgi:hypothetical protein
MIETVCCYARRPGLDHPQPGDPIAGYFRIGFMRATGRDKLEKSALFAAMKNAFARQSAYAAHRDPAVAAANFIALVVAWNGPFYPLYVIAIAGMAGLPALWTMLGSPFFFAIPWIARRSSVAGRAALPLVGILHTVWCTKLLGVASGVEIFFLPCIVLAALLLRPRETGLRLAMIGFGIVPLLVPGSAYGAPILALSPDDAARLTSLNLISVAMLMGLIALRFAKAAATPE